MSTTAANEEEITGREMEQQQNSTLNVDQETGLIVERENRTIGINTPLIGILFMSAMTCISISASISISFSGSALVVLVSSLLITILLIIMLTILKPLVHSDYDMKQRTVILAYFFFYSLLFALQVTIDLVRIYLPMLTLVTIVSLLSNLLSISLQSLNLILLLLDQSLDLSSLFIVQSVVSIYISISDLILFETAQPPLLSLYIISLSILYYLYTSTSLSLAISELRNNENDASQLSNTPHSTRDWCMLYLFVASLSVASTTSSTNQDSSSFLCHLFTLSTSIIYAVYFKLQPLAAFKARVLAVVPLGVLFVLNCVDVGLGMREGVTSHIGDLTRGLLASILQIFPYSYLSIYIHATPSRILFHVLIIDISSLTGKLVATISNSHEQYEGIMRCIGIFVAGVAGMYLKERLGDIVHRRATRVNQDRERDLNLDVELRRRVSHLAF